MKFVKKGLAAGNSDSSNASSASKSAKSSVPKGFLKTGSAAKAIFEEAENKAEIRKQEAGKMFRFRMQPDEERRVTFLDGDLDEDGMISAVMFYEHTVKANGQWMNIACVADEEEGVECPICAEGKHGQYLAVALTVIDHTPYKIKKGDNAGKVIPYTRMLYVMKLTTYKQLSKLAVKRGGLAGCTFDISRTTDKDASVGNQFDFVSKIEDGEELVEKFGIKMEDLAPANYEEEITYLTPEQIVDLGIGSHVSKPSNFGKEKALSEKDFGNEL